MITLKILEPISVIERRVNKAFSEEINKRIRKNKNGVIIKLKEATRNWIIEQPEIQSLKSNTVPGELSSLFGLPVRKNREIVESVINSIAQSLQSIISPVNQKLEGKIEFNFQPLNFSNLLGLPAGFTLTEKGESLHWMDWLLNRGSQTIIYGYRYVPGIGLGRSGGGNMGKGGAFRVPPMYSGTATNNFVIRLFNNRESEVSTIIRNLFE